MFSHGRSARGLDADRVVAGVDVAGRDAHAPAAIEIDAVVVAVGVAADGHALDADVFAAEVMAHPARRIPQRHVLDPHPGTIHKTDHERTPVLVVAERRAVAVDGAQPGDRGSVGAFGVDQATVALLPDGIHEAAAHRRIILAARAALEHRAVIQVQGDVRAQDQRSAQVNTDRNLHRAATRFGTGVDGFLDSGGLDGFSACDRAELRDGMRHRGGIARRVAFRRDMRIGNPGEGIHGRKFALNQADFSRNYRQVLRFNSVASLCARQSRCSHRGGCLPIRRSFPS